jgi:xylulokinase
VPVELCESDGSVGAALGAGIGAGFFKESAEAFSRREVLDTIIPEQGDLYNELYLRWKEVLDAHLEQAIFHGS